MELFFFFFCGISPSLSLSLSRSLTFFLSLSVVTGRPSAAPPPPRHDHGSWTESLCVLRRPGLRGATSGTGTPVPLRTADPEHATKQSPLSFGWRRWYPHTHAHRRLLYLSRCLCVSPDVMHGGPATVPWNGSEVRMRMQPGRCGCLNALCFMETHVRLTIRANGNTADFATEFCDMAKHAASF